MDPREPQRSRRERAHPFPLRRRSGDYAGDVTPGRDEDGLAWDGDDDPTLDLGDERQAAAPQDHEAAELPDGWRAVGRGSETIGAADGAGDDPAVAESADASSLEAGPPLAEAPPMGNVSLVALGIIGGFAVLYAVGWLIGGLRLQGQREYLVTDVMYQGALWLAVLAPLVWFATVYLLTRASSAWVRFTWLVAGVIVLVPWPFVMIGAIGQ